MKALSDFLRPEFIARVDEVEPKKARESLREHADLARLSKTLATIKTDWEPEFSARW